MRLLLALTLAGCASVHEPAPSRAGIGLAISTGAPPLEVISALTQRGFHVELVSASWRALFDPDLVLRLDERGLADVDAWPPAVRDDWARAVESCRARGVRGPWRNNVVARACLDQAALATWEQLIAAMGLRHVIVVTAERGLMYAPGSTSALGAGLVDGDLVRLVTGLVDGDGYPTERVVVLTAPTMPSVMSDGPFVPFDAVNVAGCVRPLSSTLTVQPRVPAAEMIEHAWGTLRIAMRTAAADSCALQMFPMDDATTAGTLDCAAMGLVTVIVDAPSDADDIASRVAKALVDKLAFDTCTYR